MKDTSETDPEETTERRGRLKPRTLILIAALFGGIYGALWQFLPDTPRAIFTFIMVMVCTFIGVYSLMRLRPHYKEREALREGDLLFYLANPYDPPRLGDWGRFKGRPEEDWKFRLGCLGIFSILASLVFLALALIYIT